MTVSLQESVLPYHDERFDAHRVHAEQFIGDELQLHHARALGRLAVVHEDNAEQLKAYLGGNWGGYNALTGEAVVTAHPDIHNEVGASHRLISEAVHELVHSATVGMPTMLNEHSFWREGMAGIGEALYLSDLEHKGRRDKVADFVLRQGGIDLWVPGSFRYYEDYATDGSANTSQGLVAASAFAMAQRVSGDRGRDVLKASQRGDGPAYARMKASFDQLKPGLSDEIEQYPETTQGIVEATAMVHDEAKRRGVIPRR
ncbi:MAG TPA: hypothetical protein VJ841_04540 [Candidatus Saccharimonadales bacterium]|nr:hypothetical protein [Candidatus Saccharimonadales bacterium]